MSEKSPSKFILDACCSVRMMWFDKKNPNVLFMDIREEDKGFVPGRPNFEIKPDMVGDFRKMSFPDKSFKLVAWDPPHIKMRGNKCWAAQKYGSLDADNWSADLQAGFNECWRVLEDWGVLIFKWSTERDSRSIKLNDVLKLFHTQPLFGHTSGSKSNTKWMIFMKIPQEEIKNLKVTRSEGDSVGSTPNLVTQSPESIKEYKPMKLTSGDVSQDTRKGYLKLDPFEKGTLVKGCGKEDGESYCGEYCEFCNSYDCFLCQSCKGEV